MAEQFYTYMHTRNDTGQPFYIGKGKGDRAWQKKARRGSHWNRVVSKCGYSVHILASWPTESESLEHEKFLISCFKDMGIGIINRTDGGEGTSGLKWNDESRARLSSVLRGVKKSPHHCIALRKPRTRTEKLIKAQLAKIGVKPSAETRQRFLAAIGAKRVVCVETSEVFETAMTAVRWLQSNGSSKAQPGPIHRCCKGTAFVAYGYHWKYEGNHG